jgi:hypothetical protein
MTPSDFMELLIAYCLFTRGSVKSYGRTLQHNAQVGGVELSAHQFWVGADVVYDEPVELELAKATAERLGLRLIREADHDHLQPLGWPAG